MLKIKTEGPTLTMLLRSKKIRSNSKEEIKERFVMKENVYYSFEQRSWERLQLQKAETGRNA